MVREKLMALVMPILLLLCPYVYFIQFNRYGYTSIESLVILGSVIGIGLLAGLLLLRKSWVMNVIITTLLLTITLSFFPFFQNDWIIKIIFVIALGVSLLFIENIIPILVVMSSVFIISIFLLPMKHQFTQVTDIKLPAKANNQLPSIVHIILDEHVGIDAIPQDNAVGKQVKSQLIDFYETNGFTLFPNAYSHYSRTYNSIPNLLNFFPESVNLGYFPRGFNELTLTQNASFKLLSQQGYVIDIFQPQYINFCLGKNIHLERCYTYPVHNINAVKTLNISTSAHIKYLTKSFLLNSYIYKLIASGYEYNLRPLLSAMSLNAPHWAWTQDQISTASVPETFNALADAIIKHPKGRVYFAHILLPHSPYIFNQYCQPNKDINTWMMNYRVGIDEQEMEDKDRVLHYQFYEAQLKCNYLLFNRFVEKLKKSGTFDNIIFIVNGDHSSRITLAPPFLENKSKMTQQDFQDSFATLYAVRFPKGKARINNAREPITRLYAKTIEAITGQAVIEDKAKNYVYLTPKDPSKREVMPEMAISGFSVHAMH